MLPISKTGSTTFEKQLRVLKSGSTPFNPVCRSALGYWTSRLLDTDDLPSGWQWLLWCLSRNLPSWEISECGLHLYYGVWAVDGRGLSVMSVRRWSNNEDPACTVLMCSCWKAPHSHPCSVTEELNRGALCLPVALCLGVCFSYCYFTLVVWKPLIVTFDTFFPPLHFQLKEQHEKYFAYA